MNEQAEVICGAPAADCRCGLPPGHAGAHLCADENCAGSWTGTFNGGDFAVVSWPRIGGRT